MNSYVFDGSLQGLLTAIFEWHFRKPGAVRLQSRDEYQPAAFEEVLFVATDAAKAERVWKGLQKHSDSRAMRAFYCAFLSEEANALQHLLEYAIYIFSAPVGAFTNYGNEHVLAVQQVARRVEREKHRMEAFVRFQESQEGLFYAAVEPDFNVLPLIATHFKNRYADQEWLIYDLKRKYGLHYDLKTVTEITLDKPSDAKIKIPVAQAATKETDYTELWKSYFKSTNIEARKNLRLHIQHVPRRYWKYLTEKQA